MVKKKNETLSLEEVAINYKNGVYGVGINAKQNIRRYGYNLVQVERTAKTIEINTTKKKSSKKKSSK